METTNPPRDSSRLGSFAVDVRDHKLAIMTGREPRPQSEDKPRRRGGSSYSRADSHCSSRHEASHSRSSVTTNGSLPGLTDASDSDVSVEDDQNYHATASGLWDSVWFGSEKPTLQYPATFAPRDFESPPISPLESRHHQGDEDTTITAVPHPQRPPPPQPRGQSHGHHHEGAKPPVKYSIYPKPQYLPPPRMPLPPRTSSLAKEPTSPSRPRLLKTSKSIANLTGLRTTRSAQNIYNTPSASRSSANVAAPIAADEVPPVPLPPSRPQSRAKHVRPSASAFSLRDGEACPQDRHNATAPLSPITQISPKPLSNPHFVSVFELDSDCESDVESGGSGLTKRFRGFHKKSASSEKNNTASAHAAVEKRPATSWHSSTTADIPVPAVPADGCLEGDKTKERSVGRKRGKSIGRIFGLKGR